jgi:hypothetical protein
MSVIHLHHIERQLDLLEDAYQRLSIDQEARDLIWDTLSQLCLFQLQQHVGSFYDMAETAGLVK